jgi:protein involved in polysaccharide export with SLBB domain
MATRLLQGYGYLKPQLNPDSLAGKQQDFIMKERTKRQLAQEAQPVLPAPTVAAQEKKKEECDPYSDSNCDRLPDELNRPVVENPKDEVPLGPVLPIPIPDTMDSPSASPLQKFASLQQGAEQARTSGTDPFSGMIQSGGLQDRALAMIMGGADLSGLLGDSGSNIPGKTELAQPVAPGLNTKPVSYSPAASEQRISRQTVHVRNPYDSIPSLYDLYSQAREQLADPKPFGADVFKRGTSASLRIPMDLPAGPDYVVGPGDNLAINLWGAVSRRYFREVDREGRLTLPDVGPVMIAGKRLDEAQRLIQIALRNEYRDVSADVSLAKLRTVRVYIVGEVARPGAYDISALSTPLNALFVAGGPTPNGSLRVVQHYRGNRLLEEVDVYDLILKGVRSGYYPLENGDSVRVPTIGAQVTISGAVRRPAIYEIHGEKNLAEVLDLAGGILPTATLQHIEVQRLIEHESHTMVSLDVSSTPDSPALAQRLAAIGIEPGDRIHIFPIAPANRDAVFLQGHVLRPGRYTYHKDIRLSDIVASYGDLLPEPALTYAEIIRLNPPSYAPTVFSFDLAEALAKPSSAPVLQPLDTVRIFGRYDFEDPPTVTVTGAVRKPGTYRTAGQIHVADAVHMAGNLTVDAYADDAQVVHHRQDGSLQVLTVNLKKAEAGNPENNILLASGDRVLVHEDENKANPATVIIQGDVSNPGRYPLTASLRVSDLIQVAGGLKRSADMGVADLTHFSATAKPHSQGHQEIIHVNAALSHEVAEDKFLQDGDVLTIRRQSGWDDIGASVTLAGEVQHPGTYGIEPGERLSSVLKRAGGFGANAYPYGALLIRAEVREQQEQGRAELIRRLEAQEQQIKLLPDVDAEQKKGKEATIEQLHGTVQSLVNNAPLGRVVIHITSNLNAWANTPADIQLRAGDKLYVPKKTEYVSVAGQVYNPTAISFRPGKNAQWYLQQAGGPTGLANKKGVFVIKADGSVLAGTGSMLWPSGLKSALLPGDTVIVPEKSYTGGRNLQNVLLLAQVASALASAGYFAAIGL